jgi:ribosomal protein S18 acetylase RimI-like enzyme
VKTRSFMQLDLRTPLGGPAHAVRHPRLDDREQLAELMLAAYRGAADDDGETIVEARQEIDNVLVNVDRPLVPDASFVIETDGILASASLVALFRGAPLVAHLMTHARYKRRGLGVAALLRSAEALRAQGWTTLGLYVTDSNEPAVTLYRKLGFATSSAAA